MTYRDSLLYFNTFINYERILIRKKKVPYKLQRFREFLVFLGNPQESLCFIHVAGSKGKGSVCAFVANILQNAGFKTGLYTSPHLVDIRERIRILIPGENDINDPFNGIIRKKEFVDLIGSLKPKIERFCASCKYGRISFFELLTAMAFIYFKQKNVDFAVIETGLGGRLDATNIIKPFVSVITPISYEHTNILGKTLEKIAAEKSAIIKNRSFAVCVDKPKKALTIIKQRCKKMYSRLIIVNKDILFKGKTDNFYIEGTLRSYKNLKIRLLGNHQLVNASLSVGAIEFLIGQGVNISLDNIRRGLYNTIWPGRCEIIQEKPKVVLDGAQNSASVKALVNTIHENYKFSQVILVLGISLDKDIVGICRCLDKIADKIILTCADNPRATPPKELEKYFNKKEVFLTANVKQARKIALELAKPKDLVLVTGSLFVVGEYRK